MGRYLSFLILPFVAIIQATLVPEIRIADGGPDVMLLFVLTWALLAGMDEGLIWAIVGGVAQDLISGNVTGTTALALVGVIGLTNLLVGRVSHTNIILPSLVAAGASVVYHAALIVLFSVLGRPVDIGYTLVYVTLPTALSNALLMLPLFRIIGGLAARYAQRRVSL